MYIFARQTLKNREMELQDKVKVIFKNSDGKIEKLTITVSQLLENNSDDFWEWLDDSQPCTSSSCNNESQNFCDCGSPFEDYEITGLELCKNKADETSK